MHDARSVQLSWRVLRSGDAPADGATDRRDRDSPAVNGGIARTNSGRGRLELPVEDRRVFEAVAGSVLADVGYELEGHDTSVGRAARIRWTLQELVQWVPRHLRVDGVVRLAPHVAALALMWAGVRRRVGLGR